MVAPVPSASVADEARGWGALAAEVADGVLGRTVHQVHLAVAGRIFGFLGPVAAPVRLAHDLISHGVHHTVRGSLRLVGAVGGHAAAALVAHHDRPWHDRSPLASRLAAIANGLLGDLADVAPSLRLPLAIREGGRTVTPDPGDLAAAFPDATSRVVVLVHGLVEDETIWDGGGGEPGTACLPAVFADHGFTAVRIRYSTGDRIATSGAALSDLLAELVDGWPTTVDQLVLVGHSMGGLVARSACARAAREEQRWLGALDHVAYLGSPHLGAPLEQVVHRATDRFRHVPELAPFVDILERRSPGIRDLRHGTITDDEVDLLDAIEEVADDPWLDGVDHHLVVGRLARSERHLVNRVLGDLLVTADSATGRGRRRRIEGDNVHVLAVPANHFGLCWHPEVADHLVSHLTGDPLEAAVS
jgi:pimeloyl-ACP methyl ester carboxylesterase